MIPCPAVGLLDACSCVCVCARVCVCVCVCVCVMVVVVVVWNCVYGRALCAEVGRERMKAGLGDVDSL